MDIESMIDEVASDALRGKKDKTSPAGRKNKGITKRNRVEYVEEYAEEQRLFRKTKNAESFSPDIIEHVGGEVVSDEDMDAFRERYSLTCDSILQEFKDNNADLCCKHPFSWYKIVLLDIKKHVPPTMPDELDKLVVVWEVLKDFLFSIGLYPTFEIFQYMTNVYKYQLEERQRLNPRYSDFLKKIYLDSKNALITELAVNPYNQTNKIFLAKAVYNMSEAGETKHIEITHNIRNLDNLPMFSDSNDP